MQLLKQVGISIFHLFVCVMWEWDMRRVRWNNRNRYERCTGLMRFTIFSKIFGWTHRHFWSDKNYSLYPCEHRYQSMVNGHNIIWYPHSHSPTLNFSLGILRQIHASHDFLHLQLNSSDSDTANVKPLSAGTPVSSLSFLNDDGHSQEIK